MTLTETLEQLNKIDESLEELHQDFSSVITKLKIMSNTLGKITECYKKND